MEFADTSIVEQIEMKMIRPSQFAVRDKFQKMENMEIETLAASIRKHGLLQPILIRLLDHGFEIIAGHRRFQACGSLRWRFIACKIREMSNKQAFEIQLTENIQRKSMDPIEEAEAFRKYVVDFGWGGVSELAKKIGKSEEYISHHLQLLKLPDNIKEHIALNRLNVSQALELTTMPTSECSDVMAQIVKDNLTVREIRKLKSAITRQELDLSDEMGSVAVDTSKPANITKRASLTLRVTLTRLDNLIDEVHNTIEPEQRADIINMLMNTRLQIHSLIDEMIRFRNAAKLDRCIWS
jgi:ParB family chromosome partitioning protein